jgi:hypothetical protein
MKHFLPIFLAVVVSAAAGCGRDKSTPASTAQVEPSAKNAPTATTLPAPTLAASDKPVMLLYEERMGLGPPSTGESGPRIDAAVWGDGRIVWRSGEALRQSRIDVKQIEELLQRLNREDAFGTGKVEENHFGPDSSFDVVEIRLPDRHLRLRSWHEGFEQNPKLVVTSHGVSSLEGRDRAAVLAAEPAEYKRFRQLWSEIKTTVKSWTPAEGGEPFTGKIAIKG